MTDNFEDVSPCHGRPTRETARYLPFIRLMAHEILEAFLACAVPAPRYRRLNHRLLRTDRAFTAGLVLDLPQCMGTKAHCRILLLIRIRRLSRRGEAVDKLLQVHIVLQITRLISRRRRVFFFCDNGFIPGKHRMAAALSESQDLGEDGRERLEESTGFDIVVESPLCAGVYVIVDLAFLLRELHLLDRDCPRR